MDAELGAADRDGRIEPPLAFLPSMSWDEMPPPMGCAGDLLKVAGLVVAVVASLMLYVAVGLGAVVPWVGPIGPHG